MNKVLKSLNVSAVICDHVIGKKHTKAHRMICGFILMAVGVFIAEIVGHLVPYTEFACNMIGYGLHGTGLLPFIESAE